MNKSIFVPILVILTIISSRLSLGEDLKSLLDRATIYKNQGMYDECILTLKEGVRRASEDRFNGSLAQCRLGECYLAMALPDKAEEELKKVFRDFSDQTENFFWAKLALIDAFSWQGKSDSALQTFEEIKIAHSNGKANNLQKAWACVKGGAVLRGLGRKSEALLVLNEAIAIGEPGPKVQAEVGRCEIMITEGKFYESISPLRQLIENAKDSFPNESNWARVRLAEALFQSNFYIEAVGVSNEIISLAGTQGLSNDQIAYAYLWKARSLNSAKSHSDAANALAVARNNIKHNSNHIAFEVLFSLGETYRQWSDIELANDPKSDWGSKSEKSIEFYKEAFSKAKELMLGEPSEDLALLQIGSGMRHLGMRDRGIAWLRMGIEDPGNLCECDKLLAQRIGSFLTKDESVNWYEYLVDPVTKLDPTEQFVLTEFNTVAPKSISVVTKKEYDKYFWLGDSLLSKGDYEAAISNYTKADEVSKKSHEKGMICMRLVECFKAKAGLVKDQKEREEFSSLSANAAQLGAQYWLQVIMEGSSGEAHGAIDHAVKCYENSGQSESILPFVESLVSEIDPNVDPSKNVFARYKLLRVYDSLGIEASELANRAEEVWQEYKNKSGADIREIASIMLLWSIHYHIKSNNVEAATRLLKELEKCCSQRWTEYLKSYKRRLLKAESF